MAQAYNLRNKIQIQQKAEQTGPVPPLDAYENYKKIWAEVRFLSGRNLYAAKAANVKTSVEFIVRYREGLDETMRIEYKGKYYEIEGIIPLDQFNNFMSISAFEIKHDM